MCVAIVLPWLNVYYCWCMLDTYETVIPNYALLFVIAPPATSRGPQLITCYIGSWKQVLSLNIFPFNINFVRMYVCIYKLYTQAKPFIKSPSHSDITYINVVCSWINNTYIVFLFTFDSLSIQSRLTYRVICLWDTCWMFISRVLMYSVRLTRVNKYSELFKRY